MKTLPISILIMFLSGTAYCQSAKQRAISSATPVTLSCVRASSGGSNKITWQTDYGSSAREITRTCTYTCSVRWSGRQITNAVLEAWFVGIPGDGGGTEMILDNQTIPITLKPGAGTITNVTSVAIGNDKATYAALGEKDVAGAQLRGCVVQLIMGDSVVRSYTSQSHLQKASWNYPFGSVTDGTISK